MRYEMDRDAHARIFGPVEDTGPGRRRKCRTCGDWHEVDRPWPHNCRPPRPPRADMATPQIARTWDAFTVGLPGEQQVISTRAERRDYMERNGLVDFETGIAPETEHWTWQKEQERQIVEDIKRFKETDTDYWTPDLRPETMQDGTLDDGTEIETDGIEIVE